MLTQEMPRASVGNRKLTNIGVGGDSIMGIRRVPEDDTYADPTLAGDAMEKPITRPLRYTPGLKCDAHLESLRPERASNHRAIQVCRKFYTQRPLCRLPKKINFLKIYLFLGQLALGMKCYMAKREKLTFMNCI